SRGEGRRRAADAGVAATADDVVTTFGTMEALHLCLRAVTVPGDTIAIESPSYYGVLQLLESLGLRVLEIPAPPGTGIDLDALEAALRPHKVRACLVATNFANPLGTLMSDDAKQA